MGGGRYCHKGTLGFLALSSCSRIPTSIWHFQGPWLLVDTPSAWSRFVSMYILRKIRGRFMDNAWIMKADISVLPGGVGAGVPHHTNLRDGPSVFISNWTMLD